MKNWIKNQKGSMTVYVIVTMLCYIFILTGLFFSATSVRKGQLKTIVKIMEAYKKDNDKVEEIYAQRQYESNHIKSGLILQYDAINNTGTGHSNDTETWKDLTGNGYDLTLSNFDKTSSSGWSDNALNFDGVNDCGQVSNLQSKLNGPITIEMCFNSKEAKNYRGLFGNHIGEGDNNVKGIIAQYENSQGESLLVLGYNNNLAKIDVNTTINKNISLTVEMDQSIGTKVYINGELVGTAKNDTDPIRPLEQFWLGKSYDGGDRYFVGKINNFMIYNRLLNDEEIKHNYQIDLENY